MKRYLLPSATDKYDAVILADGGYPAPGTIAAAILRAAGYVVCCDGAADAYIASGGTPAAIVGDCDSLSEAAAQLCADRIHRSPDQQTNDLTKAVHFCMEQGKNCIAIVGATGKREDHTIANISLLADYCREIMAASHCPETIEAEGIFPDVVMITDYGIFNAIDEDSLFASLPGQQVSIFTMRTDTPVRVGGLLYTPPAAGLSGWWAGSLNESAGSEFSIFTGGSTIIFRSFGE